MGEPALDAISFIAITDTALSTSIADFPSHAGLDENDNCLPNRGTPNSLHGTVSETPNILHNLAITSALGVMDCGASARVIVSGSWHQ